MKRMYPKLIFNYTVNQRITINEVLKDGVIGK